MKERNKKSPLEHHSNNCYRQALWNIKISRLILKEKLKLKIEEIMRADKSAFRSPGP